MIGVFRVDVWALTTVCDHWESVTALVGAPDIDPFWPRSFRRPRENCIFTFDRSKRAERGWLPPLAPSRLTVSLLPLLPPPPCHPERQWLWHGAMTSEAEEVEGLGRILTRLALTEDEKLEQVAGYCARALPPLWVGGSACCRRRMKQ